MLNFYCPNCWNDVSVWEYELISIVQLLKLCQCSRRCAQFLLFNCWNDVSVWKDVLDVYCPTVEMMSVFEKMCLTSIVQLLKWCQCLRRCAQFLLSNCWNDVSVWEYVLISIAQLLKWCQCSRKCANFYCPTVEMMSVFENMCSISIVLLLKWCQCLRRCAWRLLSKCWNDVSVWERYARCLLSNCEMMSVFENISSISIF